MPDRTPTEWTVVGFAKSPAQTRSGSNPLLQSKQGRHNIDGQTFVTLTVGNSGEFHYGLGPSEPRHGSRAWRMPLRICSVSFVSPKFAKRSFSNSRACDLFMDPKLAESFRSLRVGIGHDTHRLKSGGDLVLGGIKIDHTHSLDGHSDADVLLHAVTDAVLGAASLGDIGELFPNSSDENKNRDSGEMLQLAMTKVQNAGFSIINLDCIVFAQSPKLSPYKQAIAANIAQLLKISPDRVGVKAKTGEGVGPVGTKAAMKAQCVALLIKSA